MVQLQHLTFLSLTFPIADILHVRLQTLGISEHVFDVSAGGKPVRWLIYDVGGARWLCFFTLRVSLLTQLCRGLRHAWAPYFDDGTT